MIIDTSALMAVMRREPERDAVLNALAEGDLKMSAVSYFEFGLVADRTNDVALADAAYQWVEAQGIEVVDVTAATARAARDAYRRFGKGNHPARLNFGDCFAYALAMELDEPLLFKGADFARTDVRSAL